MKTFRFPIVPLWFWQRLGAYAITTMAHRPTLAETTTRMAVGVLALVSLGLVLASGSVFDQ